MKGVLIAAVLFSGFTCALMGGNSTRMMTTTSRESRWGEDLDYFAKEFPVKHKDFFKLIPQEKFELQVGEIKHDIPRISDTEIVLRLMRQVASLSIVHTRVSWPTRAILFHSYPIKLRWFSDGLVVVGATSKYKETIGSSVLQIGLRTPKEVEAAVAVFISHENDAGLHGESPKFMGMAEVLQHLKIADGNGGIQVCLKSPNGKSHTLKIQPISSGTQATWVQVEDILPVSRVVTSKHADAYCYEYWSDTRTLYIQYNACRSIPSDPFDGFTKRLFGFVDTHTIERVIVDLRYNGGGDSSVVKPLVNGLKSRPLLSTRGRFYALIGRDTVSSGLFAALDFRNECQAILVGKPTGEKPNHYGNSGSITLPNSRLVIKYPTKYFHLIKNADPLALDPDVTVLPSRNDFINGRDPVLDAALHHQD